VDAAVARASQAGVSACVTIGTGVEDAIHARNLALRHAGAVFATAGLDPFSSHAAGDAFEAAFDALAGLLTEGGFVAVGEIGLDYHYDLDPRSVQAERFERQLDLAARLDLPVVIHVREAHADGSAVHVHSHGRTGRPSASGSAVPHLQRRDHVQERRRRSRGRGIVPRDHPRGTDSVRPSPMRGARPAVRARSTLAAVRGRTRVSRRDDGERGVCSVHEPVRQGCHELGPTRTDLGRPRAVDIEVVHEFVRSYWAAGIPRKR
jgi:hypothetical protein